MNCDTCNKVITGTLYYKETRKTRKVEKISDDSERWHSEPISSSETIICRKCKEG